MRTAGERSGTEGLQITQSGDGVRIAIKVIPRARHNGIDGVRDGRLLIRVTAPPVDDAANAAVLDVVARALRVPRRTVRIASGERSRTKVIEAAGGTREAALAALAAITK